jgi:hypothetical protein
MGCSPSSESVPQLKVRVDKHMVKNKNEKLNATDYIISGNVSESVVRQTGSIDGQQFILEGISSPSHIFLLDHIGTVLVDDCNNVKVITGPVATSVFIRNCKNCVFIVACQQLRLRDCTDVTILLHSKTGPIIESSSNISFGCYDFDYFGIAKNFQEAGLSVFWNEWYNVFDFTPGNASNYKILAPNVTSETLLENHLVVPLKMDGLAPDSSRRPYVVRSSSNRFISEQQQCLVCLPIDHSDLMHTLFEKISLSLIQSTFRIVSRAQLEVLDEKKKLGIKLREKGATTTILAVHLSCTDVCSFENEIVAISAEGKQKFLCIRDEETLSIKVRLIFEQWKEK